MSPPLTPDSDEARRELARELSNPIYADPGSWIDDFLRRLMDWLTGGNLPSEGLSTGQLVALVVVAALLVGIVLWTLLGPVRSRRRRRSTTLFAADERTATQLRAEAEALAADGQWSLAYLTLFRAMIRTLGERGVIAEFAAMTAQEAADLAGGRLPDFTARLRATAGVFDLVAYDHRTARADQYQQLVELDAEVSSAQALAPEASTISAPVRVESAS